MNYYAHEKITPSNVEKRLVELKKQYPFLKEVSAQTINQTFKKLALKCHPDKQHYNPNANKEFCNLKKHRQILLNAVKYLKFE